MAEQFYSRQALGNIADLSTASATAQYRVGTEVETIDNSTGKLRKYIYIKNSASSLAAKATSVITLSGTNGAELVAGVPATSTVYILAGVSNITVAANYYFWLQTYGDTTVTTAGGTTAGNTGKLANGVATITDESGAVETAKTIGIIKTTLSGAGDASVFLIGKRITI